MAFYLLFETASGLFLFGVSEAESIAVMSERVQDSMVDFEKLNQVVKLIASIPFKSAEEALENCNRISEGNLTDTMRNFLEEKLPKKGNILGVCDHKLANAIQDELEIRCRTDDVVLELMRGIRLHFSKFVRDLQSVDLDKAQLGLAHSFSRSKVKFDVHRVDNMIIQAIALIDQLDKDLNTFSMRIREWYSWHFPELAKIITDNYLYAQVVLAIKHRKNLSADSLPALTEITKDENLSLQIVEASKSSMGTDISDIDLLNIETFCNRVASLFAYRGELHQYLGSKMDSCAPNLGCLIGDILGARLISHAGSLSNLAKYPASTVQILGAEKALFRALKTKGNTPKYGHLYLSTFIGRAAAKNKGRISRYLANKCSLASRIDCFSDKPTDVYGKSLKAQVEERLSFYDTGEVPRTNIEVMRLAGEEVKKTEVESRLVEIVEAVPEVVEETEVPSEETKPKKKKKKKRKREEEDADEETETPKKKKKKKKKSDVDASTPSKKKKKKTKARD